MNEELFNKLKNASDIDPDKHDGSYELVEKTVEAYATMDNLNSIDYKDLDLIYYMAVGSWKKYGISFDKKRKAIEDSHLDAEKKRKLNVTLSAVIAKANNKYYDNSDKNEPSVGMFAASFQTILGAANDKNEYLSNSNNLTLWNQQIRDFISMLVDINQMDDDEGIFDRAEGVFSTGIRGLQAGTASQILHCLKPYVFPILNRVGRDGYIALGLRLIKPAELSHYIKNCKIIKEFRDNNFSFKNYRTFDKEFWGLGESKLDSQEQSEEQDDKANEESNKTMPKEESFPKNIILYGPPGTGKTYNTVRKAVEIIEPDKGWGDKDYKAVKEEYDKLLTEGRINFVTFHQSYGYEEFVQGIKPVVDENGGIAYEVQDGVFKEFCDHASIPPFKIKDKFEINASPRIWKVSLGGAGDNNTRKDCLQNGHIRVGYDKYGEFISEDVSFDDGGKNVLNAFINGMRIGDIVLSCFNNREIDAIGIITGVYEWHNEYPEYKRVRQVKWIFKGKKDIVDINGGKTMMQATVYRLNNLAINSVFDIVKSNENKIADSILDKSTDKKDNYVFIIDEINRGNISKIFGELITLIEDNKRDGASEAMKVTLPYKKDGELVSFSVPDNVYIIGTMNTADRSIAAIDTALRRRFTFIEMMPDYEVLDGIEVKGKQNDEEYSINIAEMLKKMNERIAVLYDREHTIGHAYFMPLKNKEKPTIDDLSDIFRNKIIPLLQEYFYEDYSKIRLVLGDNRKEKAGLPQFITSEAVPYDTLFGPADEEDFGERSKRYSINAAAFEKSKAYIGIYAPTNVKSDTDNVKD